MTASRTHANIIAASRDLVERHEGRRQFPYLDTRGKTTIGIGRNLSDRGLADDEIEYLFATDLGIALSICCDLYPAFTGFSPARQAALISMAFNLGRPRLTGFRRLRFGLVQAVLGWIVANRAWRLCGWAVGGKSRAADHRQP